MNSNDVKQLLNFHNIELIGSNSLNLKYPTDYDYQDKTLIKGIDAEMLERILKHFQHIFKVVNETDKMYITDFKSGIFLHQPIRWSYDDVMQGKKEVNSGQYELLISNLDHCKLDLIVFTGKEYEEFSCNYYFYEPAMKDIKTSLLIDIKKYYHEMRYMKMLKRVLSYRLYTKQSTDRLVDFFNGRAGELYQKKHKLEVLKEINKDVDESEIEMLTEQCNNLAIEFVNSL